MTTSGVLVHSLLETRLSFPPSILSSVWIFLVLGFLVFLGGFATTIWPALWIYYRSYITGLATLLWKFQLIRTLAARHSSVFTATPVIEL